MFEIHYLKRALNHLATMADAGLPIERAEVEEARKRIEHVKIKRTQINYRALKNTCAGITETFSDIDKLLKFFSEGEKTVISNLRKLCSDIIGARSERDIGNKYGDMKTFTQNVRDTLNKFERIIMKVK